MQRLPISRSRYKLFSIMLLASLLVSNWNTNAALTARAQEAAPETPTRGPNGAPTAERTLIAALDETNSVPTYKTVDINPTSATIRFVKPGGLTSGSCDSWANACELRYALASVAVSGDQIWAAAGTYRPTSGLDRTISFVLKNGVGMYGGFAGGETLLSQRNPALNVSTLSGDIGNVGNAVDNVYHVVVAGAGIDNSAVLDGFTITAGHASDSYDYGGGMNNAGMPTIANVIFTGNAARVGGGLANMNLSANGSLTLENVTFSSNSADVGGGLANINTYSNLMLENVRFANNSASPSGNGMGGGMYDGNSSPSMMNVSFIGNSAGSGGGIYNISGNPTLTDVTFSGNTAASTGGGMDTFAYYATLSRVTFSGNSAKYGGGLHVSSGSPTLTNVTFSANTASVYGGGMSNDTSSPVLTNVTFSGNTAASGGGMYNRNTSAPARYSSPKIYDSLLWGDGSEVYDDSYNLPNFADDIVAAGCPQGANCTRVIGSDPLLGALADNGGITQTMALGAGSPAIDAGNNSTCAATDQRGVTRPQGPACDIGAFELVGSGATAWTVMVYLDGDQNGSHGYRSLDTNYLNVFNQLETAANNPNVNIVVAWDRSGNNDSAYYKLKYDTDLEHLATYTDNVDRWGKSELDMGAPSTLSDFIVWARANYPAQHYALLISDHGTGLNGTAVDDHSGGDILTIYELGSALSTATSIGSSKLDIVFADSCLMGMIEDGYQIRNYASIYIASENPIWIPGGGSHPYSDYLDGITASTTPAALATNIVNDYASWLHGTYPGQYGYTLSAVDLTKIDPLVTAISNLAGAMVPQISAHSDQIQAARNASQKFDSNNTGSLPYAINNSDRYVDLADLALELKTNLADLSVQNAAQAVIDMAAAYVISNAAEAGSADYYPSSMLRTSQVHGVSIFFPPGDKKQSYYSGLNLDFAADTAWNPSQQSSLRLLPANANIGWGPLVVDYVQAITPSATDDPNPPDLVAPASATYAISGNAGVGGATVDYTGGSTTADAATGIYSFTVSSGWTGTVTPSKTGYTFSPDHRDYPAVTTDQPGQNYTATDAWSSWYGSVSITSDKAVVAVGRPHVGAEVASYDGFASGSLTSYLPMLFKNAFGGSYDSAFYVQNLDSNPAHTAHITIQYYDSAGTLTCTAPADTVSPLSSKGYWVPSECPPVGWVGGVVVTSSDYPIVTVGRPHVGAEVMTYDGFSSGSTTSYLPMLFKNMWGYDSAFYIQNVDPTHTATVTVKYYDTTGALSCTKDPETIASFATHGTWVPSEDCLPASWVGGVVITSDYPIVAVGRPHIGSQVTTYDGFSGGSTSSYVPMLFKNSFGGSYDSALYIQNVDPSNGAHVTVNYYDSAGTLTYTRPVDTIPALSSLGIWIPSEPSLPAGWVGGAVITSSDSLIVAVGRPHVGAQVTTYDGFTGGTAAMSLPMLFKNMWGSYNAAFYVQNTESGGPASVTLKFYDVNGNLSCTHTDTIPALATLGFWVPSVTCSP